MLALSETMPASPLLRFQPQTPNFLFCYRLIIVTGILPAQLAAFESPRVSPISFQHTLSEQAKLSSTSCLGSTLSTARHSSTVATTRIMADPSFNTNRGNNSHANRRSKHAPRPQTNHHTPTRPIIFCDMDGVIVDFNGGVFKVSGIPADEMPIKKLWQTVGRHERFFEFLDWTPDGRELWEAIVHLRPTMLTGVPSNRTAAIGRQKANWCRREFQCKVNHIDKAAHKPQRHEVVNNRTFRPGMLNVISCWTRFKHHECFRPGSILIDDRIKTKAAWEEAGGIFVHHVNTQQTLAQLRELGILEAESDVEMSLEEISNNRATDAAEEAETNSETVNRKRERIEDEPEEGIVTEE